MRESSRETESPEFLHEMLHPSNDHDEFLHQMLLPFPWPEDHSTSGGARALMQQQQLLLSRGFASSAGAPMHLNDVVDPNSANQANDASIKGLFNVFTGSSAQNPNQSQEFHHHLQGGGSMQQQSQSLGGGVAAAAQPKQKQRARRGQATDPHSIAERLRRERIAERMKSLQELVPNANKTDKASMLDEIIDYVKFLQLQVKVLSMSRLGGAAAAAAPLLPQGNGMPTAAAPEVTEQHVAKLLEEDMGSAMQYLQGKGLCLMPISLATAISTATSHTRNPLPPPLSPSASIMTVQSATIWGGKADGTTTPKVE